MVTTLHDPHVRLLADVQEDVRELKTLLASSWPGMLDALADAGVPCMITGTLATADAILKDVYRGPIIEQLNYKTYMLDMIERDSEHLDFTGRRAIVPVEATGNESPSSTSDGGTLVDPQVDTEQDAIIAIRYHDGGLELTDALLKQATGNNAGAFVSKLERSSKKLASSMRKNINRQVFGDGTGLLATFASSPAAATTVTVDSTQYLRVNMSVDGLNKTTGATTFGLGVSITRSTARRRSSPSAPPAPARPPRTGSTSRAPATWSRTGCATSPARPGRCTRSTRRPPATSSGTAPSVTPPARRSARASSSCSPTTSDRTARVTSRSSSPPAASAGVSPTRTSRPSGSTTPAPWRFTAATRRSSSTRSR
jgi:hypothetical protein